MLDTLIILVSFFELLLHAIGVTGRERIDFGIFFRQIHQESRWDASVRSSRGAVGIAQIVPKFHPNVDPHNPYESLDYAARLDRKYLDQYGSWAVALAAYNAGEGNVWKAAGVPDYPETLAYIEAVLGEDWRGRYSSRFEPRESR